MDVWENVRVFSTKETVAAWWSGFVFGAMVVAITFGIAALAVDAIGK